MRIRFENDDKAGFFLGLFIILLIIFAVSCAHFRIGDCEVAPSRVLVNGQPFRLVGCSTAPGRWNDLECVFANEADPKEWRSYASYGCEEWVALDKGRFQ